EVDFRGGGQCPGQCGKIYEGRRKRNHPGRSPGTVRPGGYYRPGTGNPGGGLLPHFPAVLARTGNRNAGGGGNRSLPDPGDCNPAGWIRKSCLLPGKRQHLFSVFSEKRLTSAGNHIILFHAKDVRTLTSFL